MKYLVSVEYDGYDASIYPLKTRKEALEKYWEQWEIVTRLGGSIWFTRIGKQPEREGK